MSIAEELGISEELYRLINAALDHAAEALSSSDELFAPFLLVDGGEEPELQRFMSENAEEAVSTARGQVAGLDPAHTRYALAFDGMLRDEEEEQPADAIIVEAGERNSDSGVVVALRYRYVAGEGENEEQFEEVGSVEFLGEIENWFYDQESSEEE